MNCENVSAILDERAEQKLTPAERCALDAHLATCEDCERAWHAQQSLLVQSIPPMSTDLLDDTLRLIAAQTAAPTRRYSSRVVLGGVVLAAGAALAAITVVTQSLRNAEGDLPAATAPASAASQSTDEPPADADLTLPAEPTADDVDDAVEFPDGDYFSLLMVAPEYPLEALKEHAEANVRIQYTITKYGTVADATVVESTDSRFDAAAVLAVERWKYMPRVVNGKRVDVRAIQTAIRFEMAPPEPDDKSDSADTPEPLRDGPPLNELLARAWECAAVRNLLCAEQVLDEVSATHNLVPFEQHQVLAFFGYIYTQYEDYERAIAAYKRAVELTGASGSMTQLTLAHLYFTRQQYQLALDTALEFSKALEAAGRPHSGSSQFVDRLLQLGITPSQP